MKTFISYVIFRIMAAQPPNDLRWRLLCMMEFSHKVLTQLLEHLSLKHADSGKSADAKIALSNILTKQIQAIKKLKALSFGSNYSKLFNGDVFRTQIDILNLDLPFVVDLLTCVYGFPTQGANAKRKAILCIGINHTNDCCIQCNHKCSQCGKNKCGTKCCLPGMQCNNHICQNCQTTGKDCRDDSTTCCDQCNTCPSCLMKQYTSCVFMTLRQAGIFMKTLRNIFSHATEVELLNFMNNSHLFVELPNIKCWNDLWSTTNNALEDVITFLERNGRTSLSDIRNDMLLIKTKSSDYILTHFCDIIKHQQDVIQTQQHEELKTSLSTIEVDVSEVKLVVNKNAVQISDLGTNVTKELGGFKQDLGGFKQNFCAIKADMGEEIRGLDTNCRKEFGGFKQDLGAFKDDMGEEIRGLDANVRLGLDAFTQDLGAFKDDMGEEIRGLDANVRFGLDAFTQDLGAFKDDMGEEIWGMDANVRLGLDAFTQELETVSSKTLVASNKTLVLTRMTWEKKLGHWTLMSKKNFIDLRKK